MKKIISIILTIAMFLSVIYPCESVIAEEISKENAKAIGNEVAEMCAEYDEDYKEAAESDDSNDKIIDRRLIVETSDKLDEYGAVESVYGFGYAFLQYDDEDTASSAMKKYSEQGYTVEYDSVITSQSEDTTDTEWDSNWSYEETDSTTALDYYKYRINSKITVATIDSGITYNHQYLKDRVVRTNTNFSDDRILNDEIDNDGHGTMVAGVIAKSTPDNVKIEAYKVLNSDGNGTSSMLLSAVLYISNLSSKPDIINMSIAVPPNEIIEDALNSLIDSGITLVVAAGNQGRDVWMTPDRMENAITVAATDRNGQPCSFSNYGIEVDISAPGEYINTTSIEYLSVMVDGTSFSAPFVAAAAAIVLMENKTYTPEQVKEELIATATPFKRSDCCNLYGAGIVNFSNIINGTRCKDVTANYQSGVYREDISVELQCANTLVDIYYTTDGTLPTKTNGTKYSEPVAITESTRILAAAFPKIGSTLHSKYTSLDYYILKNGEAEYVIDDNGTILNYLGNEAELVVPDTINGIMPAAISKKCFYYYKNVKSIVLPDTVTNIDEYAFRGTQLESITANGAELLGKYCFEGSQLQSADFPNVITEYYAFNNTPIVSASLPNLDYAASGFSNCTELTSVYIPNLRAMDYDVFSGCSALTQDLKLPKLEYIGNKAFAGSYFNSILLPECSQILKEYVFEDCAAENIVLGKITKYPDYTFYNCKNLKNLYMPKASGIGGNSFTGCNSLEMIFVPMLTSMTADIASDVTIYCGDRFFNLTIWDGKIEYNYTFVSPDYTVALAFADSQGYADEYEHIDSDVMVNIDGRSIRTKNPGLRFGFNWDEIALIEQFAENIEYGFLYHYNYDNEPFGSDELYHINYVGINDIKMKTAANLDDSIENNTKFNLVFTDIPDDNQNTNISVRAYVCIDGMYFYSDTINGSYAEIANLVLNDDEINDDIKNSIKNTLVTEV